MIGIIAGTIVGTFLFVSNVIRHHRHIPTPTNATEVAASGVTTAGETPTVMTPEYKELKRRMP